MTSVLGQALAELGKFFDHMSEEDEGLSTPENPFVERERAREQFAQALEEPAKQPEPEKQPVQEEETPLQKWQTAKARVTDNAQQRQEERHDRMRQQGRTPHADKIPEEHKRPMIEDRGPDPMIPTPQDFIPTPREAHGPTAPPTKHAAPSVPGDTAHGKTQQFNENMTNFAEATAGAMEQLNDRLGNVLQRLENLESAIEARDHE